MAKRTITMLTDDLDGTQIKDGSGETVHFSLQGTDYEIDLTDQNAAALRDVLAPYVASATRKSGRAARGRGRSRASQDGRPDAGAVRAWAQANDIQVSERGRIPADVYSKYEAAN
jgi:hypothetical protein